MKFLIFLVGINDIGRTDLDSDNFGLYNASNSSFSSRLKKILYNFEIVEVSVTLSRNFKAKIINIYMIDNKKYLKVKMSSNRNFGYTFSIIFLLISLYPLLKSESISYSFLFISILILIISIYVPNLLNLPNKLWFKLGMFLSNYIATPIIMFIVFFLVVTPIGILMKFFYRKKNKKKMSSWISRSEELSKDMKNQF